MITKKPLFVTIVLLAAYVLSACGGAVSAAVPHGAAKVNPSTIAYIGPIESMDGNQWVIGGQTVTVDPAVVKGGPGMVQFS